MCCSQAKPCPSSYRVKEGNVDWCGGGGGDNGALRGRGDGKAEDASAEALGEERAKVGEGEAGCGESVDGEECEERSAQGSNKRRQLAWGRGTCTHAAVR